ncbi:murein DD-endopeptidase MepM/ murein hydrolase activator NlpD [Arthrobacter sp. UYP6]|uniref:M23 family metallopeptidase n=1 Tax=Arthrobacter sp. UYP6 TaxID=1756378 RepID=UPI00339846D4
MDHNLQTVQVSLPFTGTWRVENSPRRRVPSHGTHLLATTYAIDFVGVDDDGASAPGVSWRSSFATEPADLFFAYGRPVLAPVSGEVVAVHDGEADHEARRSQLALVPYLLGQGARLRRGIGAIAGNHVLIAPAGGACVVGVMHLQSGSITVAVGQGITQGERIGSCGNSGNSTQPHVHLQAMDNADPWTARGLPLSISRFLEKPARGHHFAVRENSIPAEGAIVASV